MHAPFAAAFEDMMTRLTRIGPLVIGVVALLASLSPATSRAASPSQLCDSAKIKAASTFYGCRCKADIAFLGSDQSPRRTTKRDFAYVKCNTGLVKSFAKAETRFGASCSTLGDVESVRANLSECRGSGFVTTRLLRTGQVAEFGAGSDGAVQAGAGRSFTDNGDGTVTDDRTGLTWEKKSQDGSIHDKGNLYTWSADSSFELNGTLVTVFLAGLNSPPCFAGHCDWRIPNRAELKSLVNLEIGPPAPAVFPEFNACAEGCSVDQCSCTSVSGPYWSSTTWAARSELVWGVSFSLGGFDFYGRKFVADDSPSADPTFLLARAVRGATQ